MNSPRRTPRIRRIFRLATALVAVLALTGVFSGSAKACWHLVVRECFDQPLLDWPWCNPPGICWGTSGNPRWGIQSIYFSTLQCDDQQSVWCMGLPNSSDPHFDHYPPNMNAVMSYGPMNLSQAVQAKVLFELMNFSEVSHDSVFWGAATNAALTQNVSIGGSVSGIPPDHSFNFKTEDLRNLHTLANGDSISMVGRPVVFLFWAFRSDGNQVRDVGAFVDNVVVSWEDGMLNLNAQYTVLVQPEDSSVWSRPVATGDSTLARFNFSTCSASDTVYPPFHVIATLDDALLMDTVITGMTNDSAVTLYTRQWFIDTPGEHHLCFVVDSLNDVNEANETDNISTYDYFVRPPNTRPLFEWVTPSADTVWAPEGMMLRWNCVDPDSDVTIDLAYDNDRLGCLGPQIPGGLGLHNSFGPDSLFWPTNLLPRNRIYYPIARVYDSETDTCVYAPRPISTEINIGADDPRQSVIPSDFYLEQNYPNPFNPETVIPYGLPLRAEVTLRVFDLLGHEVAVLARGQQEAGTYSALWNAAQVGSGVYFYRLEAVAGERTFQSTHKLVVLK